MSPAGYNKTDDANVEKAVAAYAEAKAANTIKAPISCQDCQHVWEIDVPKESTMGEMYDRLKKLSSPECGCKYVGLHFGPKRTP